MSKTDSRELKKFLKPFSPAIREIALWLREFAWDLYPACNELIYDNYNAVAFGWSLTEKLGDTFCSIAVGSNKYVHFGFYWGSRLTDTERLLKGNGNQYRYITVSDKSEFPKTYIKKLLKEAYANAVAGLKGKREVKGQTIVKSISPVKKRPK